MGPLNEFQRRWLDIAQQNKFLQEANAGGLPPEYFAYPLTIGNVATPLVNGVTQQGIITIQSDAWFLWMYTTTGVVIPNTALYGGTDQITDSGNLLLQITLPGQGGDLFRIPANLPGMPGALLSGTPIAAAAGIPKMFPTPVLLPPNTNVQVSVTKLGTNAGLDNPDQLGAYIVIHGARVQVWS